MTGTTPPLDDDLDALAEEFPGWAFSDYVAAAGRRMLVARRGSVELVADTAAALEARVEAEEARP